MLEALLENIRVLALDASKLVCVPVQADSLAAYAKARAGFSGVIRTLQGFNLVTGQVDEDALLEAHRLIDRLTADCEGLLASLVFGISPEAFLEMAEPVQIRCLVRDECLDRRLGARLPLPCPARSLRCAGLPACTATP